MSRKHWLWSLEAGDKLDIVDDAYDIWSMWHVGTIIKVDKSFNTFYKILVDYNGYNEWVYIEYSWHCSVGKHPKLKRLHTMTPCHNLIISSCKQYKNDNNYPCTKCKRICCEKCFLVAIYEYGKFKYHCKDCAVLSQHQYLFNKTKLIYQSIFHQTSSMEINIIVMITNYVSSHVVIQCGNEMKQCSNTFHIKTNFDLNNIYDTDFNYKCFKTKRIIICNQCYLEEQKFSPLQCTLFHDKQNCIICKEVICIRRSGEHCKGFECNNIYCDKCWESISNKRKCTNCNNKICSDCCRTSKCDKCSDLICNECWKTCGSPKCKTIFCEPCLMNVMLSCQCNKCSFIICYGCYDNNDCNNTLWKCTKCEWIHCNQCYVRNCDHVCVNCDNNWYECASVQCKNIICTQCGDIQWNVCNGCQYFYGQELKMIFCYQCSNALSNCSKCGDNMKYCQSCHDNLFQCVACLLQSN